MPSFMRVLAILLLTASMLIVSQSDAQACRYVQRPLAENIKTSDTVFLGTVETVENGQVFFKVQAGIRNIETGASFDVVMEQNSCGIIFRPGQRWLYAGHMQMDGSLLLEDEYGHRFEENIKMVQDATGLAAAAETHAIGGTVTASCAPWDGAAFRLMLDNKMGATVYTQLPSELEAGVLTFQLDNKLQAGSGMGLICDADGGNCKQQDGTVYIGAVTAETVSGQLSFTDGEHTRIYVFRVKRDATQAMCG
jgi:hypothetical protein